MHAFRSYSPAGRHPFGFAKGTNICTYSGFQENEPPDSVRPPRGSREGVAPKSDVGGRVGGVRAPTEVILCATKGGRGGRQRGSSTLRGRSEVRRRRRERRGGKGGSRRGVTVFGSHDGEASLYTRTFKIAKTSGGTSPWWCEVGRVVLDSARRWLRGCVYLGFLRFGLDDTWVGVTYGTVRGGSSTDCTVLRYGYPYVQYVHVVVSDSRRCAGARWMFRTLVR